MSGSISNSVRAAYGIGDFAICLYWSGVSIYLLYFYTDVVGISPYAAGAIYGIGILWDAFTDPFMGYIAERTRSKMGSYRPYIYYGSIPLALSFVLLLWVPPFEGMFLIGFLLIVNLIHRSCFTIVSVPYSSLTARITDDSDERTILTGSRMFAAAFGTFSISVLGFPIVLFFGEGQESIGFVFLGIIAGITAILILMITVTFVKERKFESVKSDLPNFFEVSKSVASNYPFWLVFSSILILLAAMLMFNNNLVYYSKYALDFHEYQWAILGTLNGITFLAVPAWAYVALKIGKKNTWLIAMILLLLGFIGFYYFSISGLIQLLFVLAFIGFANGATGVLFWSMLPDTIEFGEWKTGIRTESSLYGFMTFAQKGAIAIAAFILGMVLTGIGFEPNEVQSAQTISDLKTLMTLIPITGICISFILMWFYPIDKKFHSQLIADIQNRGTS